MKKYDFNDHYSYKFTLETDNYSINCLHSNHNKMNIILYAQSSYYFSTKSIEDIFNNPNFRILRNGDLIGVPLVIELPAIH